MNDPVGVGIVDSLARPGGNVTGFIVYEFNYSGKWLELRMDQRFAEALRRATSRSAEMEQPASRWWESNR
jgi:putative ABC transport system substrate-binding protein